MRTYTKAVAAGIAFLNQTFGAEEWRERVSIDDFDILSPCGCPLGQSFVEGDYYDALRYFSVSQDLEEAYGFRPAIDNAPRSDWQALEDEWRYQLWDEEPDDD